MIVETAKSQLQLRYRDVSFVIENTKEDQSHIFFDTATWAGRKWTLLGNSDNEARAFSKLKATQRRINLIFLLTRQWHEH